MTRLRVLGPLAVTDGPDGEIDLGGVRQQVVLAVLLLDSPRVVSVDRLIDAVWPDDPPATARGQIQICISSLRQRLPVAACDIVTRRPGYAVEVGDAVLDRQAFDAELGLAREQAAAGRRAEAVEAFGRALAQWGGETALPGMTSPLVRQAATHLEEERAAALEELCEVLLALGRHSEVATLAGREIVRQPLRERLRGQLMLGLYGAGRQADALREYRRAREVSIEDLGIEPAESLRRLEEAILRGDASLTVSEPAPEAATVVAPRMLPAEVGDFTGRTADIDAAIRTMEDTGGGRAPTLLVVSGPGGVGKSALALHLAHLLGDRFPDGHFYVDLGGVAHAARPQQVLARFLRALGIPASVIPEELEERAALFREQLAGRRVLVVVDDATLESQVLPLRPPDAGSAVLVTSRRRLTALPGATRLELGPFGTEDAVALVEQVVGVDRARAHLDATRELVALCHLLPFAVRIAAARIAARPHWSIETMVERLGDETLRLDELQHGDMAVRGSLMLTYEQLDPEARRLLRMLALLDVPHVGGWVCAVLLESDARSARDHLDELIELHLVEVDPWDGGDPAGTRHHLHELVRLFARERAAAEDPAPERTAAITRFLGAVLHLTEEAHRREYGGTFLIVHGDGVRYPVDDPTVQNLLADPLVWLSRERQVLVAATGQASALGLSAVCWDIAISSVVLFEAHGLYDDWRVTHATGLDTARRSGDELGQAAMLYSRGSLGLFQQRFIEAEVDLLAAADMFTALGNRHGTALAERNRAIVERFTGRYDRARRHAEHALTVLRAVGDHAGEAYVLSSLAQLDLDLGGVDEASARLTEADAVRRLVPNRRLTAQITARRGQIALRRADGAAAAEAFSDVLDFARAVDDRAAQMHGLLGRGEALLLQGATDEARSCLTRARDLAAWMAERRVQVRSTLLLSRLSLGEGDTGAARDRALSGVELARESGLTLDESMGLAALGDVDAATGHPVEAVEHWRAARDVLTSIDPDLSGTLALDLAERIEASSPNSTAR